MTGPGATWIGQDGHDFVGPYPAEVPDGVQDVHLLISNLPAGRTIASADLMGLGGGRWVYNGPSGVWLAAIKPGSSTGTADLYFEPDRAETGRPFNLVLRFDDGSSADLWLDGGTADPNLRVDSARVQAAWIGQDGADLTGTGVGVGPDGIQDVHLKLSGLAASTAIEAVTVTGPPGIAWESGLNHAGRSNAELVRDPSDPSKADLYFSPDRDLRGQSLTIEVTYATGKIDSATLVAGSTDPTLADAAPASAPSIVSGVSAAWIGQDGQGSAPAGWARFSVAGLPSGRTVVGAVLSGINHDSWAYRAGGAAGASVYSDPYASPLAYSAGQGGRATLAFPPDRNQANTAMTLRLAFDDGSIAVVSLAGGSTDPALLSAKPQGGTIVVGPGVDLNALSRQYGRIELAPGVYNLSSPLVLTKPVTIIAPYGNATLQFNQPDTSAPWTSAIKIQAGNTTLQGFAVRFGGPVRWQSAVNYGPAVIGSTDNLDTNAGTDPMEGLALVGLDLQGPPPTNPGDEAVQLIRLTSAGSGRIEGNTLRGGTTRVMHGPWSIVGNTYLGTMPGSWAWEVFATHFTHDLVIKDNVAAPAPDAGKTWRFLVMTGSDDFGQIVGNQVSGIGPRDTDTVNQNASEVILTESYGLSFEGTPLAISDGGRILQIPTPQGDPPGTGSVVAILDGPDAGRLYRIAQALGPSTFLMADPLPSGRYTVSIGSGFLGQTYQDNTIDIRGGSVAAGMVLVGNHYGTQVLDNHILGGGEAIRVAAFPTEKPSVWGWSHTPFLGGTIAGNTIEDSLRGITVTVMHGAPIKLNKGRLYLSADVHDNTIVWSDAFAAGRAGTPTPGLTIGEAGGVDRGELRVDLANNRADAPIGATGPTLNVQLGTVNGQELHDSSTPLPSVSPDLPSSLALVADTGSSASDGLTRDGRLAIGPAAGATSFEYRVGDNGPFVPVSDPSSFLPAGLTEGTNAVTVRAVDDRSRRGPARTLTFTLDTTAPTPVSDLSASAGPRVSFRATEPGETFAYRVGSGSFVALGTSTSFTPEGLALGANLVQVVAADAAGNVGAPASVTVRLTPTPAPPVSTPAPQPVAQAPAGRWIGQDGSDFVGPRPTGGPDGVQDIHIALTGLPAGKRIVFVDVQGLGGSRWQFGGDGSNWKAALIRTAGSTTADLYLQPDRAETGRPFQVTLRYDDGTTDDFWVAGGTADPNLKVPTPSNPAEARRTFLLAQLQRRREVMANRIQALRVRILSIRQPRPGRGR